MTNSLNQIKRFQDFIEDNYYDFLLENVRKGNKFLLINFSELSKYDPDLATGLLDSPEETIKAIEKAVEQFDFEGFTNFRVRFYNLPRSQHVMIRDIRSDHINTFCIIEGMIRQKSDVLSQTTSSRFECSSCGNILNILQLDDVYKEPNRCNCGHKGKFTILDECLVDVQHLSIEEDNLEGSDHPRRIGVILMDDLCSPINEKQLPPGSKVEITGIVKKTPIILKKGKSTKFDLFIEVSFIKSIESNFYDVNITEEEKQEIFKIAEDSDGYKKLINSIIPSIYGHEKIKEALLLQMLGGVRKHQKGGIISRGDTHILIVGDPGVGKSAILKRISQIAPKGRYVSGKGSSGIGLTAAVVKDEFTNGFALEAGAMALSNNGVVCIDELDKMNPVDRSSLHEGMENQTISISKSNIQKTLSAKTTVLAAANPKFGRFDPYGLIADQIDMPPTLINRFDLIFPVKDIPDREQDKKMSNYILNSHQNPEINEPEIPIPILRKFIAYARQNINPILSEGAKEKINNFYLEMRNSEDSTSSELKPIPISLRQLEALIRLSEASAKTRLSNEVKIKDAEKAIELLKYCLMEVGFDKESGKIDIDRIAISIPTAERNFIYLVREKINELKGKYDSIPIDELFNLFEDKDHAHVEETIHKMRRAGDIYEPRAGFIKMF